MTTKEETLKKKLINKFIEQVENEAEIDSAISDRKTKCYLCGKVKEGSFFCDNCLKDMINDEIKKITIETIKENIEKIDKNKEIYRKRLIFLLISGGLLILYMFYVIYTRRQMLF